jgi:hypothetical protein
MDIINDLGPTVVARLAGCKPPSVTEWRKRGIPVDRCPVLERGTDGRYTCETMRPDIVWHRVPDDEWLWHPAGRPLHDVAKAALTPRQTSFAGV